MAELRSRWVIGGGTTVLIFVAVSMWGQLRTAGSPVWNAFLAVILIGVVIAAVLLQLYFMRHPNQVGEARFNTQNRREEVDR